MSTASDSGAALSAISMPRSARALKRDSINLEDRDDGLLPSQADVVTLYFAGETGSVIVPVSRMVYGKGDVETAVVELIKGQNLDIAALKKERSSVITDSLEVFEPNIMLLDMLEKYDRDGEITNFIVIRTPGEDVIFEDIVGEDGVKRSIKCSNVRFVGLRG